MGNSEKLIKIASILGNKEAMMISENIKKASTHSMSPLRKALMGAGAIGAAGLGGYAMGNPEAIKGVYDAGVGHARDLYATAKGQFTHGKGDFELGNKSLHLGFEENTPPTQDFSFGSPTVENVSSNQSLETPTLKKLISSFKSDAPEISAEANKYAPVSNQGTQTAKEYINNKFNAPILSNNFVGKGNRFTETTETPIQNTSFKEMANSYAGSSDVNDYGYGAD